MIILSFMATCSCLCNKMFVLASYGTVIASILVDTYQITDLSLS